MGAYEILELTRIVLSLVFLAVSSYCDYKWRRVPDQVFKIFMPTAAALTVPSILLTTDPPTHLITYILYIVAIFVIFYAVSYLGLFGGADANIVVGLTLAVPWPLTTIRPILETEFPILPVSIFNNALLSSITTLPYAAVSNIAWKTRTKLNLFNGLEKEPLIKKVGAMLFCVKKEKSKVRPYDIIAERLGKLTLFNKVQEEDLSPEELQSLPENVFVTFSLPLVIFIAIGFVITILLGDLVLFLVKNMLDF